MSNLKQARKSFWNATGGLKSLLGERTGHGRLRASTGTVSNSRIHFEEANPSAHEWGQLDDRPDRNLFQTWPWIAFIAKTQNAKPTVLTITVNDRCVGWFTGLLIRKGPFKILGSPFRGWTTPYMGFNLDDGIDPAAAVRALRDYAFRCLNCVHVELADCRLNLAAAEGASLHFKTSRGYALDLTQSEERLMALMHHSPRRYIRKATREQHVLIEEAGPEGFAQEYYSQLRDLYAQSSLVPTYDLNRVKVLIDCLYPTGKLLLLRARDRAGQSIATGIFPAFNRVMHMWGVADRRAFRRLHTNEPLQWFAIQYWKNRGTVSYDMGAGEDYKVKYGAFPTQIPWVMESKWRVFKYLRSWARRAFDLKQQVRGLMARPEARCCEAPRG